MHSDVLVVGGGLAAMRTCVELRAAGFTGSITLVGAEARLPYDRPPLSKAALHAHVDTQLAHDVEELDLHVLLGAAATGLDLGSRTVRIDAEHGKPIGFTTLVIATGAAPVRLPGAGDQMTLRDPDDAARLRSHLDRGARVVVAGAGWIGAEVASAALARSCAIHCVEAAALPLAAVFGSPVAQELLDWWDGVDLRTGRVVRSVEHGHVLLDDGTELPADVVLSAVGVRPNTGWLVGSGIDVDRGVVVGPDLQTSVEGVFAVGDVAARWSPRSSRRLPGGHWADAAEAPAVVAAGIVSPGRAHVYDPVPYFWSDQFGHKLQLVGVRGEADDPVLRRDPAGRLCGVGWLDADGALSAYLAIDRPRDMIHAKRAITTGARPDPRRLADGTVAVRAA